MKLAFYTRRDELGTVESGADGALAYAGPSVEAVRSVVDYYIETTDLRGDDLLKHVVRHVRGQTRAEIVEMPAPRL